MYEKYHTPITLKKGKSEVILAFGIGAFDPQESKDRNLFNNKFSLKPWIKFKGDPWTCIKKSSNFTSLEQIENYIKDGAYSEEQFLEHIFELV